MLRLLEVPLTGCHREQLCHDITQFPSSMLDRSHSHPLAWPTNPLMVRPRRLAHFYPPHRDPTLKLFIYDSRWRIEVRETLARDSRLCGSNLRLVGRNFYLQFWHWFDSFHFSVFLVRKDVRNNGINSSTNRYCFMFPSYLYDEGHSWGQWELLILSKRNESFPFIIQWLPLWIITQRRVINSKRQASSNLKTTKSEINVSILKNISVSDIS